MPVGEMFIKYDEKQYLETRIFCYCTTGSESSFFHPSLSAENIPSQRSGGNGVKMAEPCHCFHLHFLKFQLKLHPSWQGNCRIMGMDCDSWFQDVP